MNLAFINANVLTMDESRSRAEAVLIRGERIAKVGSTEEIERETSDEATVVDLNGRTVLPGFIDGHTHFVGYGLGLSRLDFKETPSVAQALAMVRGRVEESEQGELIIGEGWDQSRWREGRYPTREELDAVAPQNPLVLRRVCGHVAIANSRALELLVMAIPGVDRETGVMLGAPALNANRLFPPSFEETLEGIRRATEEGHRLGVTSVHDIVSPDYLTAYQELARRGELKMRVYSCFYDDYLDSLVELGLRTGFGDDRLKFGGIKIFADGSLGAGTAALSAPYHGRREGLGTLTHSDEELIEAMEKAEGAGIQILVHAIGDRAIGQVLTTYEDILQGRPNRLRHRIEHLELPTSEQLKELKELGLIASMQPNFVGEWGGAGGMYEKLLGKDRWRRNSPLREVADLGIPLAFGSDSMPFSPLYGIDCALNHPVEEQRMSVEEAVKFYTLGSAYASFEEDLKGSLTEGKLADLVVLSEDITKSHQIGRAKVLMTLLGGEVVFEMD